MLAGKVRTWKLRDERSAHPMTRWQDSGDHVPRSSFFLKNALLPHRAIRLLEITNYLTEIEKALSSQ